MSINKLNQEKITAFSETKPLIFSRIVSVIRKAYATRTIKFCAASVLSLCVAGSAYAQSIILNVPSMPVSGSINTFQFQNSVNVKYDEPFPVHISVVSDTPTVNPITVRLDGLSVDGLPQTITFQPLRSANYDSDDEEYRRTELYVGSVPARTNAGTDTFRYCVGGGTSRCSDRISVTYSAPAEPARELDDETWVFETSMTIFGPDPVECFDSPGTSSVELNLDGHILTAERLDVIRPVSRGIADGNTYSVGYRDPNYDFGNYIEVTELEYSPQSDQMSGQGSWWWAENGGTEVCWGSYRIAGQPLIVDQPLPDITILLNVPSVPVSESIDTFQSQNTVDVKYGEPFPVHISVVSDTPTDDPISISLDGLSVDGLPPTITVQPLGSANYDSVDDEYRRTELYVGSVPARTNAGTRTFRYCLDEDTSICSETISVTYSAPAEPVREFDDETWVFETSMLIVGPVSAGCTDAPEISSVELNLDGHILTAERLDVIRPVSTGIADGNTYSVGYRDPNYDFGNYIEVTELEYSPQSDQMSGQGAWWWAENGGTEYCWGSYRIAGQPPAMPSVCDRTQQVRDEIVRQAGVTCELVTSARLATITRLVLESEGITQLQASDFNGLTNLEFLDLSDNQLQTLPEDIFDDLTNLATIDLTVNRMQSLPADIFDGLTNLSYLNLFRNQLQSLNEDIFDGLTNLEELFLWNNQLQTLPEDIFDGLTNLEALSLSTNQLQTLPAGLFDGLTSLEALELDGNQLRTLPVELFDDTDLEYLDLENNPFSEGLPLALIEEAKEFVEGGWELYLDIVAVNDVLSTRLELILGDTENVDLENAFFSAFDDTYYPASAYTVSVADNTIATAELTGAHTLTITATTAGDGETTIKVVGTEADGNTATQILTVAVRSICDRTQQVQDAITTATGVVSCEEATATQLETITTLNLSYQSTTQLQPGDLDGLTNLEELDLSSNELQTLPADIFDDLTNLEYLALDRNQLQALPASIFNGLTKLEELVLGENQLQTLPANVFDGLTDLRYLDLDDNPFGDGLPSAVIERLESVSNVTLDLVAVNNALPPLRMPIGSTKTVSLEDAFFYADDSSRGSASTYKITVTDETVATVTETSTHTLMIMTLEEGETEIEVVGFRNGQRATQTFTVTAADSLIFRIKVFLEGAQ